MEAHRQAVARIAASVRLFFERGEPFRIAHGSTNSTRPGAGRKNTVDISALRNVLSVDTAARTALVEPNVPMDRLVEHTLRHGLVPPVVMEFPGITAGGGFAGTAGESSSFSKGFFDDNVESVEMVLADGEVVTVRRGDGEGRDVKEGDRADLFRGAAGAVGTLGVTTLLELRLEKARRFVRTTYRRTSSVTEAVRAVQNAVEKGDADYVDGILFSKDHGAVITGTMTDELPAGEKVQTFSGAWDPWFYMHVEDKTRDPVPNPNVSMASTSMTYADTFDNPVYQEHTEYIPLAEYLFRYDRAGFWVGRSAFRYFPMVPFTKFTRWFLDDFLHTRMMYRALHASEHSQAFVVQDLALPFGTAKDFVDYTSEEFGIWPLWLCPLKRRGPPKFPTFHPFTTAPTEGEFAEIDKTHMLNIGLWGEGPRSSRAEWVARNKGLETKLGELGGMKWLYAHTYYGQEDFWQRYGGREWYDKLREKYNAMTLPTVWDKVYVNEEIARPRSKLKQIWPIGGLYGIWKSIQSKDYHIHRNSEWKYKPDGKEKTA